MPQAHAPNPLEDAGPHPALEAPVAGAPGTVLRGDHLPLATRAQDVQNPVEHGLIRYLRPSVGAGRFFTGQKWFNQFPKVIGNLAESIPLPGSFAHGYILHDLPIDLPMLISALMHRERKRFWDAL